MVDPYFQSQFNNFGFILNSIGGGSYVGIFLSSMFVSFLIPLPEVVLLILIGFLVKTLGIDIWTASIISVLGTIAGDNLLYRLSFFGNKYVERFNRKMRAHKLIQYEHLVKDNIGKSIFFLRFVTGVRFFGPVISGTLGVKWSTFFSLNAIATVIHGAFFIALGYFYKHEILILITEVEIVRNVLLFSSVLIVGVLLKIFSKKAK